MKISKFLLATIAIYSLNFGFVSCSSDDDEDQTDYGIFSDDKTWDSLVKDYSWLNDFPAYPEKFGTSSIIGNLVMIGDYNANADLMAKYKSALTKAGFIEDSFMGSYNKEVDGIDLEVVISFQEIQGASLLSVHYSKKLE